MALKRIAFSALLNAAAAGAGLIGTTLIVWYLGPEVFGRYVVALAEISLIMLGMELLPGTYSQFKLQDDPQFAEAMPIFYLLFALAAVCVMSVIISAGVIGSSSWFMLIYVFSSSLQRCLDGQILARGEVKLLVSVPLVSNTTRAIILLLFMELGALSVPSMLWGSLAIGAVAGHLALFARRPDFFRLLVNKHPVRSLRYLWSLRRDYPGYYVNSVLKRAKETLFPLFCDAVLPAKAQLGALLVYTRTSDTIAGQIRILELFFIHRQTRASIAKSRRRILLASAAAGHIGVIVVSSFLLRRQGISITSVLYGAGMGLFMYPYVYELAKRSDAYARHAPQRVTFSILAFLVALAASLTGAWLLDIVTLPVLIGSLVLAQSVSAFVYMARQAPIPEEASASAPMDIPVAIIEGNELP